VHLGNHDESNREDRRHIQAKKYPALTSGIFRRKDRFTLKVTSKEFKLKSALTYYFLFTNTRNTNYTNPDYKTVSSYHSVFSKRNTKSIISVAFRDRSQSNTSLDVNSYSVT
jgi:hypothetical protein